MPTTITETRSITNGTLKAAEKYLRDRGKSEHPEQDFLMRACRAVGVTPPRLMTSRTAGSWAYDPATSTLAVSPSEPLDLFAGFRLHLQANGRVSETMNTAKLDSEDARRFATALLRLSSPGLYRKHLRQRGQAERVQQRAQRVNAVALPEPEVRPSYEVALHAQGLSPATVTKHLRIARKFEEYAKERASVNDELVVTPEQWVATLGLSPSSAKTYLGSARKFLQWQEG